MPLLKYLYVKIMILINKRSILFMQVNVYILIHNNCLVNILTILCVKIGNISVIYNYFVIG
jgi:hypothetical protein